MNLRLDRSMNDQVKIMISDKKKELSKKMKIKDEND